jgi:hypothetical protein
LVLFIPKIEQGLVMFTERRHTSSRSSMNIKLICGYYFRLLQSFEGDSPVNVTAVLKKYRTMILFKAVTKRRGGALLHPPDNSACLPPPPPPAPSAARCLLNRSSRALRSLPL